MMKTLYLHVGSHRTATTSIQQFLLANFRNLIAANYFYPFGVARHNALISSIFSGEQTIDEVSKTILGRAEKQNPNIHSIILSDEDISNRKDISLLADFKKHFNVKVFFSLRRQDVWLESWYFQNVKWQWNADLAHITFDEFLEKRQRFHWIHYDQRVKILEEVFGAENVILNVFEKGQMPDGPVIDFCNKVGLTDLTNFTEPPHVNSSMSAEMVEFIRHLPLDKLAPPERDLYRVAFEQFDRKYIGGSGKQSERLMAPSLRKSILSEYASGNEALAKRYFQRSQLFMEPLPADDAPLAKLAIPQDSKTLLERFIGPLILHLVENGTVQRRPPPNKK